MSRARIEIIIKVLEVEGNLRLVVLARVLSIVVILSACMNILSSAGHPSLQELVLRHAR